MPVHTTGCGDLNVTNITYSVQLWQPTDKQISLLLFGEPLERADWADKRIKSQDDKLSIQIKQPLMTYAKNKLSVCYYMIN